MTSANLPEGWTDVRRGDGKVLAPNTYVDAVGVLRSVVDDSCVVWHDVYKGKHCSRKGFHPDQIAYDGNGAPWCPDCLSAVRERHNT